jgi:hypothetical protein
MASAVIESIIVTGPVGDTLVKKAAAYQDVVEAQIIEVFPSDEEPYFVLRQTLAAPVPLLPPLLAFPSGTKHMLWVWGISSDETTSPVGFPFTGIGQANPYEYMVWLGWDGSEFTGVLLDRRPLLLGEAPILRGIEFAINGDEVVLFVPAILLDNCSQFQWRCGTVNLMAAGYDPDLEFGSHLGNAEQTNGNQGFVAVDHVGFPFTAFP